MMYPTHAPSSRPQPTGIRALSGRADRPVQARIVDAASRLFADKGYAATSTAEIVAAAGVTKPMVYYYFSDKAGLFQAVMEQVNRVLGEGLSGLDHRALAPREALIRIARLLFRLTREAPTTMRLHFASYYGPRAASLGGTMEAGPLATHVALHKVMQRGLEQGLLQGDPYELACAFQGTLNFHLMTHLSRPAEVPLESGLAERTVDLLLRGAAG